MYFSKEWDDNPNAVKPVLIQKYIMKKTVPKAHGIFFFFRFQIQPQINSLL